MKRLLFCFLEMFRRHNIWETAVFLQLSGLNRTIAQVSWERENHIPNNPILSLIFKAIEMKFKQEHTFEQRKAESDRVRAKYPDRVPGMFIIFAICER